MILDELDYDLSRPIVKTPNSPVHLDLNASQSGISQLRARLLPVVAMEDALASELSGGLAIGGGRAGVFVRAGWQSLVTSTRSWPLGVGDVRTTAKAQIVTTMAAKALYNSRLDINALWEHPAVKRLITLRHLKLEEAGS